MYYDYCKYHPYGGSFQFQYFEADSYELKVSHVEAVSYSATY